jgi:uncharacterized repeat protein (TIGR01451 family)
LVLASNGDFSTQASATYSTSISALPLVVTQTVDNVAGGIAAPGDTLQYTVTYRNNAGVAASAVNIVVTLDSPALDLASIRAEGGEVNNNTISWNASGVPNLERLNPNESGKVQFAVKLKNPAVKDAAENITIKSSAKIKSNEYSSFLPGTDLELKVSSPSNLTGAVKFISGQLPLRVGQGSDFQVTMMLRNSTNDVNNAVLVGFVPGGVAYEQRSVNAQEGGNVSYDVATGKLTWKVGQLAAHTGDINPPRTLTFNVRLNPPASAAGRDIVLFKSINFTGKDAFTAQDISLQAPDLKTTDIPNGYSDGRVGE